MIVSSFAKLESKESCSACDAKSTMVEIVEFEAPTREVRTSAWSIKPFSSLSRYSAKTFAV